MSWQLMQTTTRRDATRGLQPACRTSYLDGFVSANHDGIVLPRALEPCLE
jgi:hypothetical protein